jgi:hypothetical protein
VADLSELQASQSVKIAGANPSTGVEDNYLDVDTSGRVTVKLNDSAGSAITLGQTTMANSVPVTLASNQDALEVELQDGTGTPLTSTLLSSKQGLDVNVINSFASGIADKSSFTYGTTVENSVGGVYQDTSPTLSAGTQGAVRLTQYRAFHTNLRDSSGNELLGQKTMANGISVTIASDQTHFPIELQDGSGNNITSTTINSKQRLDVNLSSEAADGAAIPATTMLIGGETPTATIEPVAMDASGNIIVVGSIASASADSGSPVKIGTVFNTTLPTVTNGQRVDAQADANGRLLVAATLLDSNKPTYSASITGLVVAAAATDIFTITGSASKTIRVLKIRISGNQSTASTENVLVIKRSAANSGGTSTSQTAVPHDSNDAAASATVLAYTVSPSLGAAVGTVRSEKLVLTAAATGGAFTGTLNILELVFGHGPSKAIVLRGTSQVLAINLNAQTLTGSSINIDIEWTEE